MTHPIAAAFGDHNLNGPNGASGVVSAVGNLQFKFRVTGSTTATHTYDQSPFFYGPSADGLDPVIGATYSLRTPVASMGEFTLAGCAKWVARNPMALRNVSFIDVNNTGTLPSLEIRFRRATPFGSTQSQVIYGASFLTSGDFQTTRLQIPVTGEVLDSNSYAQVITACGEAASITDSIWTFAQPADVRHDVAPAQAAVLRSPGSR